MNNTVTNENSNNVGFVPFFDLVGGKVKANHKPVVNTDGKNLTSLPYKFSGKFLNVLKTNSSNNIGAN